METRLSPSGFSIPIPDLADLVQPSDGLEIQGKDELNPENVQRMKINAHIS
ncbi:MAG: hypothetical protein IKG87_15080 [Clostridia bacterium]|nr:hypothetical protein [Clostridia bacterium]